jgi:hypothetical protein
MLSRSDDKMGEQLQNYDHLSQGMRNLPAEDAETCIEPYEGKGGALLIGARAL